MVRCAVSTCKNKTKGKYGQKICIKVFAFPKDERRAKLWLQLAGHASNHPHKYSKICKYHFTDEDVEHSLSCRLLGKSFQKEEYCRCPLKPDVNPSINVPGLSKEQSEKDRERAKRIKQRENKKIVEDLLKNSREFDADGLPVRPLPFEYVSTQMALPGESLQVFSESEDEIEIKVESPSSALDITENNLLEESNFEFVDQKTEPVFEAPENLEDEEDLSELCRLCALPGGDMVEIFGTDGLSSKINFCLPVKVSESDSLPLRVCRTCVSGVEQSHCLSTACLDAQDTLNNIWQRQQERQSRQQQGSQSLHPLYTMPGEMDTTESLADLSVPAPDSLVVTVQVQGAMLPQCNATFNLPGSSSSTKPPQRVIPPPITTPTRRKGSAKLPLPSVSSSEPVTNKPLKNVPLVTPQIQVFSNNSKIRCQVCNTGLMSASDAQSHCLNKHKKFLCEYCFKLFEDEDKLSVHLNLEHKFVCGDCGFIAIGDNKSVIEEHKKLLHDIKKMYFCMKCKNKFKTELEFVTHVKESCLVVLKSKEKKLGRPKKTVTENVVALKSNNQSNVNVNLKKNVIEKKNVHVNILKQKASETNNDIPVDLKKNININFQQRKRKATHVELKDVIDDISTPISDYDCKKCYKFLSTKNNLKIHYQKYHSVKLCLDDQCPEYFDTEEQLIEHCASAHSKSLAEYQGSVDIVCDKCGKVFKMKHLFEKHVYYDHLQGDGKHPCTYCDRKFRTSTKLKRHLTRHTGKKEYECHICGKMFYDSTRLSFHSEIHKGKRHACTMCDKKFTSKRNLNKHKDTVHDKRWIYNCNVCSDKYLNEIGVNEHYNTHTEEEKSLNKCESRLSFNRTSPFQCTLCFKYYPNRLSLKIHLEQTHSLVVKNLPKYPGDNSVPEVTNKTLKLISKNDVFKCDICSKQLSSKLSLKYHLTTHLEEKRYPCEYCSQSFTLKGNLIIHTRLHTNETPFKCGFCDKEFRSKINLKFHVDRVHLDIRKYSCKLCPKRFHQLHHLQCHIRVHTNERPYSCHICQQKFKQVGDMRRHVVKHNT